jgi:hypothetical protein
LKRPSRTKFFNQNFVRISHLYHACHMPHSCPRPLFKHPTLWRGHLMKPLMRDVHNSNATSSLSGPNILISTLLSNILHLLTSFRARDQVSHIKYIEIYIVRRMNGTIFYETIN